MTDNHNFDKRIKNNQNNIIPEPVIGSKRMAEYIGSDIPDSAKLTDPNATRSTPKVKYPVLVIELNTAYAKKVLEDEFNNIKVQYQSRGATPHSCKLVSIFILMDAETIGSTKNKTLVYWREAIIDINFINCLNSLLIKYRYLESKGKVVNLQDNFEKFLDYEEIGQNIIDDKPILDFGIDELEENISLEDDLLFNDSIISSIQPDSIKDIVKDKPITIQEQINKEIINQPHYEDAVDVNLEITSDAVDVLKQENNKLNEQTKVENTSLNNFSESRQEVSQQVNPLNHIGFGEGGI